MPTKLCCAVRKGLASRARLGKRPHPEDERLFRGSSAVEQPAVNRLVVGSNPTRGANLFRHLAPASPTTGKAGATARATTQNKRPRLSARAANSNAIPANREPAPDTAAST